MRHSLNVSFVRDTWVNAGLGSRTTGLKPTELDQWFSVLVLRTQCLFVCLPYWTHQVQIISSLGESLSVSGPGLKAIDLDYVVCVKEISDFKILEHFKKCQFNCNFLFQFALFLVSCMSVLSETNHVNATLNISRTALTHSLLLPFSTQHQILTGFHYCV